MRIVASLLALAAVAAVAPALAQQGPKVGELEIKAYQPIPKTKVAVQLTSDTHLSRELRREVMIRLARRGNEVGFSGGNVMRMDVTYFDLGPQMGGSGPTMIPRGPQYDGPGANPRPDLPGIRLERRDSLAPATGPTLRITLTLYAVDTGKVLWVATASCYTQANLAMQAGVAMLDNIFGNADKNRVGDAGCPL
ncbi:MAG: hypothetical protein KIT25_21140 [Enhydrobacter sp.]|nr:MAG: hypothetical protein KIT25_21140 [Enhydrobacter sp.]